MERKRNYTYQLSKPGADSNARRMAKCLCVLTLSLLQHQIPSLTAQTKKKINTMSSFILHCYIRYWFTSPSLETETCNQLAREIGGLPPTSIHIRKPTLPSITSSSTLPDFVGPRSILFFSQLKLDHTFLLAEDWRETPHFSTLKSTSNLHPVNDSSEREPWRWPPASMGGSQEMRNHTRTRCLL